MNDVTSLCNGLGDYYDDRMTDTASFVLDAATATETVCVGGEVYWRRLVRWHLLL